MEGLPMFFNEPQQTTLIVVCKDELLTNQLKKYVETNAVTKKTLSLKP